MTKDEALRLALEVLADLGMKHYENTGEVLYKNTYTAIKAALEAKDEPVGSFMTRLQAIDFLLKMRPQTEPTEKQIIATIDAYSALFGDMIESPASPQRKPLTEQEIDAIVVDEVGLDADADEMHNFARAIEAAHGITGENT